MPQLGVERLLLALLGCQVWWRISIAHRDRKQIGHQRSNFAYVVRSLGEYGLQPIKPLVIRIFTSESGSSLKLCDDWVKSTVLVVGRAEIAQPRVRLIGDVLKQGSRQA